MCKIAILFFFVAIVPIVVFSENIKKHEFAGGWYPADPKELSAMVEGFLQKADPAKVDGKIIGLIAPHAGYVFSGPVAAFSYKAIQGKKYDAIILFGPSHHTYFEGAVVYPNGKFTTPLGELKIDSAIADALLTIPEIKADTSYFNGEHSLEMQLPFIQKTLPNIPIVPILFGDITFDNAQHIAAKVAEISAKKNILVIASSDMSHYHPYDDANEIDSDSAALIKGMHSGKLWSTRSYKEGRACGIAGIVTMLEYLSLRKAEIAVLDRRNSGDTSGDKSKVVGYLSAVGFINNHPQNKEASMLDFSLSKEEKKQLLEIARQTLDSYVVSKRLPKFKVNSANLSQPRGAFVTLMEKGQLRGCIGHMEGDVPLYQMISERAIDAATNDPRFPRVTADELPNIDIEISVLTPFKKVQNLNDIEVGKHGLMIQKGFYRGVFLPQVPVSQGWDRKTYLEELCHKAGLSDKNAYLDKDAEIYCFEAIVFGEKDK